MSVNNEGIKTRGYGIEIECTGITRNQAAVAVAKALESSEVRGPDPFGKYTIKDNKDRKWSIVYDGSIRSIDRNRNTTSSRLYSVELISPVLAYEDIPMLQEVVRALRKAGAVTGAEYKCGIHIHISADDFDARSLRNLVNIFASKEDFLWEALQVSSMRSGYCEKVDQRFNCRTHLLKHLDGNIAWRHPEDAIAQRERLRQERIEQREQACSQRTVRANLRKKKWAWR